MFSLPLNSKALPYPDPIHPIVVHFVIAMVLFSFVCDLIGYFTHNVRLFEVSWWNLWVASLAVFGAVLLGQFEAAIAPTYAAVQPTLTAHTFLGWGLAVAIVALTALRFVMRRRYPTQMPAPYLGFATALVCLVAFQTYLGSQLVWVYGLHVEPVVEALRAGALP
ncbi:MAG: DUF2231 domain-containing protein [Almyronema sp.]